MRTSVILLVLLLAPMCFGAQQRTTFDHLTTGFELLGQHRDLACESCHVNAVFKGTTRDCASCHGVGTTVRASAKSARHILTTDRCETCHTPVAWIPAVNFDHTQTHGSCTTCHNNVQAQGKGPQHISTNLECNVCHSTVSWAGALFNHDGVTGGCAQCHNGVTASGMPSNHIPTGGAPCESCHSSTNFSTFSGTSMNHTAVAGMLCATCHEAGKSFFGVTVITRPGAPHPTSGDCGTCHSSTSSFGGLTQMPANHIPTSQPCTQCHSNPADYSIYSMSHQGITSGCANCHAAGLSFANMAPPTLKELPANHIPTGTLACESCHSTTNFTTFSGTAMNHSAVTASPCSTCHEAGKSFVGSPPIVTRPALPHVATGECSNCHFSTTTFAGAQNMPPNHIPLPAADGGNCALCHTNASDYSVYTMNHTNITNNCAQCHGPGLSFANIAPPALKQPPTGQPAHIPTGTIACELCHSPTNFATFAGTIMRHAAVSGQACDSCHELGMAWYGEPRLWVRDGPNHHPGQDCGGSGCHSPRDKHALRPGVAATPAPAASKTVTSMVTQSSAAANTTATSATTTQSAATTSAGTAPRIAGLSANALRSGLEMLSPRATRVDHTLIRAACANCHNGITATGKSARHVMFAAGCDDCHTTNAWIPARFDHAAVGPHPCTSCHDAVHAIGRPHNHIPTTQPCGACHGTLAWSPVKLDHSVLTGACATCHNNAGAVGKPAGHLLTQRDCATCHSYPEWNVLTAQGLAEVQHERASQPQRRARD